MVLKGASISNNKLVVGVSKYAYAQGYKGNSIKEKTLVSMLGIYGVSGHPSDVPAKVQEFTDTGVLRIEVRNNIRGIARSVYKNLTILSNTLNSLSHLS